MPQLQIYHPRSSRTATPRDPRFRAADVAAFEAMVANRALRPPCRENFELESPRLSAAAREARKAAAHGSGAFATSVADDVAEQLEADGLSIVAAR